MSGSTCAIVVTYNRRDLLRECLSALQAQSIRLDKIVVFDNASTDGTGEMLSREFSSIKTITSPENRGGAGGFHEGIKWASENQYDWLWIMDDDSMPNVDALECLLKSVSPDDQKDSTVFASRVVWTDGDVHPMNRPQFRFDGDQDLLAVTLARGRVPIRSASFVSVLINRAVVQRHGLPFADYFIWIDDLEYTARILREGKGFWVPSSIVMHKTLKKRVERGDIRAERRYYSLRNRLWMILRSDAWTFSERVRLLPTILKVLASLYRESGLNATTLSVAYRGMRDGLFTQPMR